MTVGSSEFSERTFIDAGRRNGTAPAYGKADVEARKAVRPLMLRYQDAITVTDTYHETKSRFAWIGEIENERLLTALESLSRTEDLEIITHLRSMQGIPTSLKFLNVYGVSQKAYYSVCKIKRITKFLKNFRTIFNVR